MPTITLRPAADGSLTQLDAQGAGDNYVEVDEVTADGDTTYVNTPAGGFATRGDLYTIGAHGLTGSIQIDQIEVFVRARDSAAEAADRVATKILENSTTTNGTAIDVGGSYEDLSTVYTTRPSDSTAWQLDDITNLEIGIHMSSSNLGADDMRVTQVWVVITYTQLVTVSKNDQTPTDASGGVSPSALLKKRYIFLSETDGGDQKDMTESWNFESIVREANGSSEVFITTDKNSDNFNNGSTDVNNAITIRVATGTTGTEGLDYFTGYIVQRTLVIDQGTEKVVIRCVGHISKLYKAMWRDGTTIVHDFTGGDTASNIAKDIIDKYRTLDANMRINYTGTSVESSGTTVKDKFEAITFGQGLDRVIRLAHTTNRVWIWRVLGDNIFTFKKVAQGGEHQFIMGRDITSLMLQDDLINANNEVFTYYGNTATRRVSNAANIIANGYISDFTRETNVPDAPTADEIGNAILTPKLPPLLKLSIVVSDKYVPGIETINQGDTCEILNVSEQIRDTLSNNMIITKMIYRKDEIELELSIRHPLLESEVENIRRKFIESRTEGIPSTFTDV